MIEQRKKTISVFVIRLFIVVSLCSLIFISGDFNDSYIQPKYYLFVIGVAFFAFIGLLRTRKRYELSLDPVIISFLSFCCYFIIRGLFSYITFHNVFIPAILVLFFLFRSYQDHAFFATVIVSLCIIESSLGILQITGITPNPKVHNLVGSFDNPAGIASFLSLGFPFCFFLRDQDNYKKYIGFAGGILIIITIILSQSRAGVLAVLAVLAFYFFNRYRSFILKNKKKVLPVLFAIILILSVGLFLSKKDSASGRVLIWRVTAQMIGDDPVFGKGAGTFAKHYMEYQGDYFETHSESQFAQLAGNTKYAFNEYLQITSEYGVLGLLFFLFVFFMAFKSTLNKDMPNVMVLIALLVFSCFSYPLRYPIIWVIATYSIATISQCAKSVKIVRLNKYFVKILFLIFIAGSVYCVVKDYRFESKWRGISKRSLKGQTEIVLGDFERLFNNWNGNPYFLYNYGAELNHIDEYEQSLNILYLCERFFNDNNVQILIADNYFMLEDWQNAGRHYTNAANMCPSKFSPLQGLLRTHIKSGNLYEAEKVANNIIQKEVKISAFSVALIKAEAEDFLETNK